MSVYASKRNESKAEFIRVAQQLATYTLEQVKKFPKSYRFCLTNDITRLELEIQEDVLRANSIYIHNNMMETEFNLREEYFAKARSAIFALSGLLTVTFSLVLKGNNFLGDKKKTSGIFKEWARLLNYEAALVKESLNLIRNVIKSIRARNLGVNSLISNSSVSSWIILNRNFGNISSVTVIPSQRRKMKQMRLLMKVR